MEKRVLWCAVLMAWPIGNAWANQAAEDIRAKRVVVSEKNGVVLLKLPIIPGMVMVGRELVGAPAYDYTSAVPRAALVLGSPEQGAAAVESPMDPLPRQAPEVSEGNAGNQRAGRGASRVIPLPRLAQGPAPASSERLLPYTRARVDLKDNLPSLLHPYRQTGKLFIRGARGPGSCTAALVAPGIIVTAAHCVTAFGATTPNYGYKFVPALSGTHAPFGEWQVESVALLSEWAKGTDTACAAGSMRCTSNLALLRLRPRDRALPGTTLGWYGVSLNGWGAFSTSGQLHVTQLGYAGALDQGARLQRMDAAGSMARAGLLWGGDMGDGASGGPVLLNLGVPGVLETDVVPGTFITPNVLVGVVGWRAPNLQVSAAVRLDSENFGRLMTQICADAKAGQCK